MKIKCIKTKIDNPSVVRITNSDMSGYILIGSIFWVYGIRFSKGITYYYIYNGNHLVEVPMELFEIIEGHVSSTWVIKVRENGEVNLWPELFYVEDFLENFSEHERKERDEFILLRKIIEE